MIDENIYNAPKCTKCPKCGCPSLKASTDGIILLRHDSMRGFDVFEVTSHDGGYICSCEKCEYVWEETP